MKLKIFGMMAATSALGACTLQTEQSPVTPPPVPENIVALAAPYQNVQTARLMPDDNCYWYEHAGQVETTLLPLNTAAGRQICVQRQ
ncbi:MULTISPECIES: hypothetical protein [Paracoccaceae]|jgi:hypothetical protein|uniref:hypothetical protein n=1 Tax=Paracoccaceae TaxID=31989 RepID=UPI001573231B|nr:MULTISPECIES: hypothetical protein [Paracoccaceae]MBJ2153438.1 hypothetical protein [Paracoccus sp. IB05]NTT88408.1 hypothetical protein [Tabrizicola sp. SY72]